MPDIRCSVCFRGCLLKEGQTGFCRARRNENGKNVCASYGRVTALAKDPIEKKPLARFFPGSYILSVGSYGCNLSCPFCQNWQISMADERTSGYEVLEPEALSELALRDEDNLGVAFTYNEPMISYEYILDTAKLIRPKGKKIVLVTNGCASDAVLEQLAEVTDAMNIDLKGDREFYKELGGSYDMAKHTIETMHQHCHVEVTSLIIPGKNDSEGWIRKEAEWLSSIDRTIPLHITRYFPRWHYDIPSTPRSTVFALQKTAQEYLDYVYAGNV